MVHSAHCCRHMPSHLVTCLADTEKKKKINNERSATPTIPIDTSHQRIMVSSSRGWEGCASLRHSSNQASRYATKFIGHSLEPPAALQRHYATLHAPTRRRIMNETEIYKRSPHTATTPHQQPAKWQSGTADACCNITYMRHRGPAPVGRPSEP